MADPRRRDRRRDRHRSWAPSSATPRTGSATCMVVRDMARRYGLPAALYRDGSRVFAPTRGRAHGARRGHPGGPGARRARDHLDPRPARRRPRAGSSASGGPSRTGSCPSCAGAGATDRAGRQRGPARPSCLASTAASRSRRRARCRPGGRCPPSSTSAGCAPSAGAGRSAATARCASRAPSSSCRPGPVVARSRDGGWRSSCASTAGCWSWPTVARSPPSRRRPSHGACARCGCSRRGPADAAGAERPGLSSESRPPLEPARAQGTEPTGTDRSLSR